MQDPVINKRYDLLLQMTLGQVRISCIILELFQSISELRLIFFALYSLEYNVQHVLSLSPMYAVFNRTFVRG